MLKEASWRLAIQLMVGEPPLTSMNKYPARHEESELTRQYANKPRKMMCGA